MKVQLLTSISRFINESFKVYKRGEVVDLPHAEALRMIELRRAVAVESEAPAEESAPAPKRSSKRVL